MTTEQQNLPIGVFDSGVGGLTVLSALQALLPNENFIYLGDTARLPYGSKSKQTVVQYAHQGANILVDLKVKCLVVACNTASSVAIEDLQASFAPIPVIGVIEPGARACTQTTSQGKVLVLATESTTQWHAYKKAISSINQNIEVIEKPCPLFVALAEEGWTHGALVDEIVQEVLKDTVTQAYDCVVLGCTHYPMLKDAIAKCYPGVAIIDSATVVAKEVQSQLCQQNLQKSSGQGKIQYLATDSIERFKRMASRFMGHALSDDDNIRHQDVS